MDNYLYRARYAFLTVLYGITGSSALIAFETEMNNLNVAWQFFIVGLLGFGGLWLIRKDQDSQEQRIKALAAE